MSETGSKTFEQYQLPFGYPLALEGASAGGSPFKFASKLVGCVPGEYLLVTLPKAAKASSIRSGQKLLVKIMAGNGILAFACQVEQVLNSPKALVFLSYPTRLSFKEIRGATRIELKLPVTACVNQGLQTVTATGLYSDISVLGARVALKEPIAEVGDVVTLDSQINLVKFSGALSLQAVVRARVERSTQEMASGHPAVYGVEFLEMEERQRLILYALVYSIMAGSYT